MARIAGLGAAKELVLTGEAVDAHRALQLGIVSRVVPPGDLMTTAVEIAQRILQRAPLAIRLAKKMLNLVPQIPTEGAMALESWAQGILFESEDKAEGTTAFLENDRGQRQMSHAFWASALIAILFGSAITTKYSFPSLITNRTARVTHQYTILQDYDVRWLLLSASALFFVSNMPVTGCLSALLLMLNLYQRFWVFTKLHLVGSRLEFGSHSAGQCVAGRIQTPQCCIPAARILLLLLIDLCRCILE
jgi:hypothetical protein